MVQMLGKRGAQCSSMATSLVKQLEHKMKASSLTTTEVLQLSQHLDESGLPDGCKDDLLAQCDQLVIENSHQSAVKLSLQAQTCDHLTNYLTASDWKAFKELPFWQAANVLIARLKKIGVKSLKESLKKRCIAIMVLNEMEKGKPFPTYKAIYDTAQQFSSAFLSSSHQAAPGVPCVLTYPMQPSMVNESFVATAYDNEDPPVSKHLEDLNFLVLHHIPVRSTSRLLREDSSKVLDKKLKRKSSVLAEEDLEDRVADRVVGQLSCKLERLLGDRSQAPGTVARPCLSLSKPLSVEGANSLENMKPKALLNLPSANSFTCSEASKQQDNGDRMDNDQLQVALPDLEEEQFQELKNEKTMPKSNPTTKPKEKNVKGAVLKRPAASVLKRPAASVQVAPQDLAEQDQDCWGCLGCRGNVKGCLSCRKKDFAGLRCNGREAWKAALAKDGKSWK